MEEVILKKIFLGLASLSLLLSLTACGNKTNSSNQNARQASSQSSQQVRQNNVVGSYKDTDNDVAMTLKSDSTGRYVYADPQNSNTDDQLTWKKTSSNIYTLNLQDSNITSPITAKFNNGKLILTGNSNWHTVTLNKSNHNINLDQFLAQADPKTKNNSTAATRSSSSKVNINNADEAVSYLKRVKGNGNYTIAHGTFGMSSDPYATIQDDNGNTYYVYHDGRIEQQNDNDN